MPRESFGLIREFSNKRRSEDLKTFASVSVTMAMPIDRELFRQAYEGNLTLVEHFISSDANPNAEIDGRTPLMFALYRGHFRVVKCLVAYGARVDVIDPAHIEKRQYHKYEGVYKIQISSCSLLSWAAREANLDAVRCLVECGADVNARDSFGETALMKATLRNDLSILKYLVENDADVERKNFFGQTPLMVAQAHRYFSVVKTLVSKGALVDVVDPTRVNLRRIVTDGGSTHVEEMPPCALLIWAAQDDYEAVQCLIECGANVNIRDASQETALMKAAKANEVNIVKYLIKNGADVDAKNYKGETAIRMAAARHYERVEELLAPLVSKWKRNGQEQQTRLARPNLTTDTLVMLEIELLEKEFSKNGECQAKWLDADVVVKWFNSDTSQSSFSDETYLWERLRHPNVIKLYEACGVGDLQIFVQEFASKGSLIDYVKENHADPTASWKFIYEAALGLQYLHERNIVHGNLQCKNILIGSDGVAKLANFSLSEVARDHPNPTAFVAAMRWRAPELLPITRTEPTFESDVYSLGLCILEAMTKKQPWGDSVSDTYVRNIKPDWVPETSDKHEPDGLEGFTRDLVKRMCSQDPAKRASLAFVIDELKKIANPYSVQPGWVPEVTLNNFNGGKARKLWETLQKQLAGISDLWQPLEYLAQELSLLYNRVNVVVGNSAHVIQCFHGVVQDFSTLLSTFPVNQQSLQSSISIDPHTSIHEIEHQIFNLWRLVGESRTVIEERRNQQRRRWVEILESDKSGSCFMLNNLQSPVERDAILNFLKVEIQNSNGQHYSHEQIKILQKIYQSTVGSDGVQEIEQGAIAPNWFIRRFELGSSERSRVGKGGFGCAYHTKWLGSDVVVKELGQSSSAHSNSGPYSTTSSEVESRPNEGQKLSPEVLQIFYNEVDVWFKLRHPHVVELFGACHNEKPFFVCEHAPNGTLRGYLHAQPKHIWEKLYETALGVQYLHARGVVHCDLKGDNILIGKDGKAKVTDFGLSFMLSSGGHSKTTAALHWVAPECLPNNGENSGNGEYPTFKSDVYALGMCIVEAMRVVDSIEGDEVHLNPWCDLENVVVKMKAKHRELPPRPKMCTDTQWILVERMCCFDPEKRIVISTVVEELGKLAGLEQASVDSVESSSYMPTSMIQELLMRLQDLQSTTRSDERRSASVYGILELAWNRLQTTFDKLSETESSSTVTSEFSTVMKHTQDVTTDLIGKKCNTISEFTTASLRALALHRQIDKFLDANFLSKAEGEAIDDYRMRCKQLIMGVKGADVMSHP